MNVLITGFDPFGGEPINPAWEAVKAMKDEIAYSAIGEEALLSELLHKLAPKVTRVSSPAATSLSATNPIIHVTQCLFNLSRIENGEDFDFFGAPLTKRTAAFMEECDKERLAIGKALGLELAPLSLIHI